MTSTQKIRACANTGIVAHQTQGIAKGQYAGKDGD